MDVESAAPREPPTAAATRPMAVIIPNAAVSFLFVFFPFGWFCAWYRSCHVHLRGARISRDQAELGIQLYGKHIWQL